VPAVRERVRRSPGATPHARAAMCRVSARSNRFREVARPPPAAVRRSRAMAPAMRARVPPICGYVRQAVDRMYPTPVGVPRPRARTRHVPGRVPPVCERKRPFRECVRGARDWLRFRNDPAPLICESGRRDCAAMASIDECMPPIRVGSPPVPAWAPRREDGMPPKPVGAHGAWAGVHAGRERVRSRWNPVRNSPASLLHRRIVGCNRIRVQPGKPSDSPARSVGRHRRPPPPAARGSSPFAPCSSPL